MSALSQGTGLQALARASQKLARPDYFAGGDARRSAIFEPPAPEGVALKTAERDALPHYSSHSRLLVLNGFLQSLIGLFDYAQITGRRRGPGAVRGRRPRGAGRGRRPTTRARGRSTRRRQHESDLGYHQLVRHFLTNLCDRTTTAVYCDTATAFTTDLTSHAARDARRHAKRAATKKPGADRASRSRRSPR